MELFITSDSVQSFGSVRVVSHDTKILGIPIGCHLFVQTRCSEIANSGHALCSELIKLRAEGNSLAKILPRDSDELLS